MSVLWYHRDGTPLLAESGPEWTEYMRALEGGNRMVARFIMANPRITISTVFLGLNHAPFGGPPVLFETMAFWRESRRVREKRARPLVNIKWVRYQERYTNEAEALAGHLHAIAVMRRQGDSAGPFHRPPRSARRAPHLKSVSTSSVMIPGTNARTLA